MKVGQWKVQGLARRRWLPAAVVGWAALTAAPAGAQAGQAACVLTESTVAADGTIAWLMNEERRFELSAGLDTTLGQYAVLVTAIGGGLTLMLTNLETGRETVFDAAAARLKREHTRLTMKDAIGAGAERKAELSCFLR